MSLLGGIFLFLLRSPVPPCDAQEIGRPQRMWTLAASIHRAVEHATCHGEFAKRSDFRRIHGSRLQLAAALVVLAQYESGICERIHRDECGPHECDPARVIVNGEKSIVHLARGPWQTHRLKEWSDATWNGLAGTSMIATGNRHSSRLRAEAVIAVYMPIAELAGIPSILDVDEAREIKSRRVWRRTRPRTPWGYGKDRGIGAMA